MRMETVSILTLSPFSPSLHSHHVSILMRMSPFSCLSPFSESLHSHPVSILRMSPGSPCLHSQNVSILTQSPFSEWSLHSHHVSILTLSPKSPDPEKGDRVRMSPDWLRMETGSPCLHSHPVS